MWEDMEVVNEENHVWGTPTKNDFHKINILFNSLLTNLKNDHTSVAKSLVPEIRHAKTVPKNRIAWSHLIALLNQIKAYVNCGSLKINDSVKPIYRHTMKSTEPKMHYIIDIHLADSMH